MMKPSHALKAGIIVSIAVVILFVFSAAAPAMSSSQQVNAFASEANLLPNPVLDSNVTWSTFNHGWKPLEYTNGTANETLNAQVNSNYKEPFTINPTDIQAPGVLQNENLSGAGIWSNLKTWSYTNTATSTTSTSTIGKENDINLEGTGNATLGKTFSSAIKIPISDYPSSNPSYDYITAIYSLSGPSITGVSACVNVYNYSTQTGAKTGTLKGSQVKPGENIFFSEPLTDFKGATFNTTPGEKGYSQHLGIQITINTPSGTTDTWTATLTGLALTYYQMNIGTNSTGQAITETTNSYMKSFDPSFTYTSIINGGYTVAVSQSLQNLTTQQSEITGNPSYVEQVTYEGSYYLPTAPDLSYSSSVISEKFNVSSSQTTVLDINGLSLLNTISGKNGTISLVTVNPNQKITLIQIVDYTSSQWESVSGPPGFFSVNGILYYFDEIVLGIIAVVGLAGGAAVARTRSLRRVK